MSDEDRIMRLRKSKSLREEIADALDMANRFGPKIDEPEGVRYIQMSDTLARQWATLLRGDSQG